MPFLGNLVGQGLGYGASKLFGASDDTAKTVAGISGSIGSAFLPFRKGGYLKLRKGGVAGEESMGYQMGGYVPPGLRQISGGPKQFTVMPYPVLGEKRII